MTTRTFPASKEQVAEMGEDIYCRTLKEELEASHKGEYVVIDVLTGKSYLDKYGEIALMEAREQCPYGLFYIIRIGGPVRLGVRHVR
ncbi:MAG: hypothetical protein OXI05_00775 [Bacteroidota bacterium]|nr:hypothetical protein [Bacteroidota bacterium]MDE2644359.1 hypothetical protein [Bacteroidota bacterium]